GATRTAGAVARPVRATGTRRAITGGTRRAVSGGTRASARRPGRAVAGPGAVTASTSRVAVEAALRDPGRVRAAVPRAANRGRSVIPAGRRTAIRIDR